MSSPLNMTLVDTRKPPSWHIWATALSPPNSLLPSSPDLPHAARWWPRTSRRRPHRRVRTDRSKDMRRRRSNETRNCSESILDTRCCGIAVNGTEDKCPLCDLTIARSGLASTGHTCNSLWWASTICAACSCHPCPSAGSRSAEPTSGRAPAARASHWECPPPSRATGRRCPPLPADTPSPPLVKPLLMCSATTECLSQIISRQSAQLPQKAAPRILQAPPTPRPPNAKGNDQDEIASRWR